MVDLNMYWRDGALSSSRGRGRKLPSVTIGRTESRRGLGFEVDRDTGEDPTEFVLNREQVQALMKYLAYSIRRLKK